MADLNLPEWKGLVEFLTIDLTAWGQGILRYCNSKLDNSNYLTATSIAWGGVTYTTMVFETQGWRIGGEGVERPSITVEDFGAVNLNLFDTIGGATLAPVTRVQAFAADVVANITSGVISTEMYAINKVSGDGLTLEIELTGDSDGPRTQFPSYKMTEEDAPGLRSQVVR